MQVLVHFIYKHMTKNVILQRQDLLNYKITTSNAFVCAPFMAGIAFTMPAFQVFAQDATLLVKNSEARQIKFCNHLQCAITDNTLFICHSITTVLPLSVCFWETDITVPLKSCANSN
jgi:hypothetical protein